MCLVIKQQDDDDLSFSSLQSRTTTKKMTWFYEWRCFLRGKIRYFKEKNCAILKIKKMEIS